jgi:hypothetical protein
VSNTAYGPLANFSRPDVTSGTVTVTETPPQGLTLVSMAGTGSEWTCASGGNTCTTTKGLAAGSNYSTITVTVKVAANAPSSVINQVSVSGGGALGVATVNTVTSITAFSTCDVLHVGSFSVSDVQQIILEAIGSASPVDDLNNDGVINIADVQIVMNAVLSRVCF